MGYGIKCPNIITRKNAIPFIALALFCMIMSGMFLAKFIYFYPAYDIEYSDLMHEELTYKGYRKTRSDSNYQIYFEEYEEPFYITNIANRQVNREALDKYRYGVKFSVYYKPRIDSRFDYDIYEMTNKNLSIIELEDYLRVNRNNEIGSIIVLSLMEVVLVGFFMFFAQVYKPGYDPMDIGKLRIDYTCHGNWIQVYKSLNVVTLKINGEQVDQFIGTGTSDMCLKGTVTNGMQEIPVEVREKFALSLTYNGMVVAKKIVLY